jgi:hypothetical protein
MLRLWLEQAPDVANVNETDEWPFPLKAPGRPPDFDLLGEGEAHPTFWRRCPRLEHLELFRESMPDEAYPNGWWAALLWLAQD